MAQMRQMHADLVRAPRFQPALDQGVRAKAFADPVMRHRRLARRLVDDGLAQPVMRMTS